MIFNKIFETKVVLDDINDIFNPDIDNIILNILKTKYTNSCFKSCFIIKVNHMVNRSLLNTISRNLDAHVNVDVMFEAEVLCYEKFELLLDNEIVDTSNDKILANGNDRYIMINNKTQIMNNFIKGQKIPIFVGKCSYPLYKKVIEINAYPFIPILENEQNIYYNIEKLTEDEKEKLQPLIDNINTELKTTTNKESHKFFEDLLYPFSSPLYKKLDTSISHYKLIELDTFGVVSQLNENKLNDGLISNIDTNKSEVDIKEEKAVVVYTIYLSKYFKYLKMINDLANYYNTKKLIEENKNIFDLYTEKKY